MPKFRKKQIVVEAEQWFPGVYIPEVIDDLRTFPPAPYIDTLVGRLYVDPGDWIVTGAEGEKYPCKPRIFDATYEEVEG